MISSTQTLPDGYRQTYEIDLMKNKGLAILLNLLAGVIFVLSLALVGWLLQWKDPQFMAGVLASSLGVAGILALLTAIFLIVLVHELIHGLFFWIFTRSRPVFALRLLYAYAAAPDWFIPARRYWIIGLAPLVIIDAIGLLFIFLMPPIWISILSPLIAVNTAGAVGDLYIVARLLLLSSDTLVRDLGDSIGFFEPEARSS